MTGDCDVREHCVSSKNYPDNHGNNEKCTIRMTKDAKVVVGKVFHVEKGYDKLKIGGKDRETRLSIPSTLKNGDEFTWTSDHSVSKSGWRLCFKNLPPSGKSTLTFLIVL